MSYSLTQEQIEEHKLPKYIENAIQSPVSQKDNHGILEPENWRELAVAVHKHTTKEAGCTKGCDTSEYFHGFGKYSVKGIKNALHSLLSVVNRNAECLEISNQILDKANLAYDASRLGFELKPAYSC